MGAILSVVTLIGSLTAYMVLLLIDDRTANGTAKDADLKKKWHIVGGAIHLWGAVHVGLLFGWPWGVLCLSLLWLVFDGMVNKHALNREFFYVGTTAYMDRAQRWIATFLGLHYYTITIFLKSLFLFISTILVIYG